MDRGNFMKHFYPADILLPKNNIEKWAVVACDQYTSEPEYWEDVKKIVGDTPSALKIILPEVYLGQDDDARIEEINENMKNYLKGGVFEEHKDSMIFVERQSGGTIRRGIVGLIDLEEYDYSQGSHSLIRATEATVVDRIPPRVKVRQGASLEMPHILLLIDDPARTVIEPLKDKKYDFTPAYDFDLMKNSGHIKGWLLDKNTIAAVQDALDRLLARNNEMLFAVGDGNHSLATAKECYKLNPSPLNRYAMVEIVNIHDESIQFEPIYRVLFNVDERDFLGKFIDYSEENGGREIQRFSFITSHASGSVNIPATAKLPIGTLQHFIDLYIEEHPEVTVDYIHGDKVVASLCRKKGTLGFIFDGMSKSELFPAIVADGPLPRKTFSMGHAEDKRFYLEAREITGINN